MLGTILFGRPAAYVEVLLDRMGLPVSRVVSPSVQRRELLAARQREWEDFVRAHPQGAGVTPDCWAAIRDSVGADQ